MKVILLKEIPNLGNPGDVVDVKRGYAINYLLKDDRAIRGTEENLARVEEIKLEQAKIEAKNKEEAQALADLLNETVIEIPANAGETGKLFGSITTRDIADLLSTEKEINLDRKKIQLSEPIRSLGEYDVLIKPYPEVEATLKVNVIAN